MIFTILLMTVWFSQAQAQWPQVVTSKDGSQISYEVYGDKKPTLIFIHGWSCDSRYWRNQTSYFSRNFRVVLVDLAGHGHSNAIRKNYTMRAFGEDVQAVTEAVKGQGVILIGHSMGGAVIAEAALLMPKRVKGLIGVDTLENIEYALSQDKFKQMIGPLQKDFQTGTRQFAEMMISPETSSHLRHWIPADMSSAQPAAALSAMKSYLSTFVSGEAARIFENIRIPVITVNADMWPINYEGNRRHMFSFDAIVIKGSDHFLMLTRPDEFNRALEKAIAVVDEAIVSK
ncbi:MAG: alpha/beta hydrolase [Proteobacteria bacterium]|nr:alpha/beta hydrolase [Pseudomonadota bacterium]